MKRTLLFIIPFIGFLQLHAQIQYVSEDFVTGGSGNPPVLLPGGWTQDIIAGDSLTDNWVFDNPGGRFLFFPIDDPAAIFDSDENSNNTQPENVALVSPVFAPAPGASVFLQWNQFFRGGFGGDAFVEVFDGSTWQLVWSAGGVNSANPDTQVVNISAFTAGNPNSQVRFRWTGDWSWYWIVDNVEIFSPQEDVGVVAYAAPESGCGLGANEIITVTVENLGFEPVSNIPVAFQINGGGILRDTIFGFFPVGADTVFTFGAHTADLSVPGLYQFEVFTELASDGTRSNDTLSFFITHAQTVSSFPYVESFEFGPGGWWIDGQNSSWELGIPSNSHISQAADGNQAWVTNLSGDYNDNELSYLISPCFDFSALSDDPVFSFRHSFQTEFCCDEGWIETSTDAGQTWTKLGTAVTGLENCTIILSITGGTARLSPVLEIGNPPNTYLQAWREKIP